MVQPFDSFLATNVVVELEGFFVFEFFFFFLDGPEMSASSRSCNCKSPPGKLGAHSMYANAPI